MFMYNPVIKIAFTAIAVLIFYLALRGIYCVVNKSKFNIKKEILPCIFACYIGALICILITRNMHSHIENVEGVLFLRIVLGNIEARDFNLIPFKTLSTQIGDILSGNLQFSPLLNIVGNFIVFAPLPVFIKLVNKRIKSIFALLISFVSIIAVEVIQYLIGRAADIDDVILNMAGCIIAVIIFDQIVKRIKKRKALQTEQAH